MHGLRRDLLADTIIAAQAGWLHRQATAGFARSSEVAAHEEQPARPDAGTAPSAAAASAQQGAERVQKGAESAGKAAVPDSDSEDDENIGPDDWDDLLAVWMTAVGLPNFGDDAQPDSVSETSESSSEDEDPSGMCCINTVLCFPQRLIPCGCWPIQAVHSMCADGLLGLVTYGLCPSVPWIMKVTRCPEQQQEHADYQVVCSCMHTPRPSCESLLDQRFVRLPGVMAEQFDPQGASLPQTVAASRAAGAQGAAEPQQSAVQPSRVLPAPEALPASQIVQQQVNHPILQFLRGKPCSVLVALLYFSWCSQPF